MLDLLSTFVAHPFVPFIGFVTGVAGLPCAFYFYFRGKKERRPFLASESVGLVDGVSDKFPLELTYDGVRVNRVTVTRLYFWNHGRESIRRSDLIEAAPVGAVFPQGCRILTAQTIAVTDSACGFAEPRIVMTEAGSKVLFDFDHLNASDGAAVQVVHDGGVCLNPEPCGKVIGTTEPVGARFPVLASGEDDRTILPRPGWDVWVLLTVMLLMLAWMSFERWDMHWAPHALMWMLYAGMVAKIMRVRFQPYPPPRLKPGA